MQRKSARVLPALVAVLASLLILSTTAVPAKATSMETVLSPNENEAVVRYESVQVLNIKYPNGGEIGSKLAGKNIEIKFSVDSSDPAIQMLMKDMNAYLLRERGSTVTVKGLLIDYRGELKGFNELAALSHKVTVRMTIAGYVVGEVQDKEKGKMIDLNWRTFIMGQPVLVETEKYGLIDINRPSGFIMATIPSLMEALGYDRTLSLLNKPALDFSKFAIPMDDWRWDIDSNAQITVITTKGEIGRLLQSEKYDVPFEYKGMPHQISLTIPPPSGTIQIPGFAKAYASGSDEAAIVYEHPQSAIILNPFAMQVLIVLGVALGVISIIVSFKARK